MKKLYPLHCTVYGLVFVMCIVVARVLAFADEIVITPVTNVQAVFEGDSNMLTYTVTNVTGRTLTIAGRGFVHFPTTGPDPTDDVKFNPLIGCVIGQQLAPGGTCNLSLPFDTPRTIGDIENDMFGLTRVRVLIGVSDGSSGLAEGLVRVQDNPMIQPPAVFVGASTASVLEGGGGRIGYLIYNISNNPAVVTNLTLFQTNQFGDGTDDATIGPPMGCAPGTVIIPGVPCLVIVDFTTPATKGEGENSDVGDGLFTLTATLNNGATGDGTSVIEVVDQACLTPEPSTLVLLGSGLASIAALAQRRRR